LRPWSGAKWPSQVHPLVGQGMHAQAELFSIPGVCFLLLCIRVRLGPLWVSSGLRSTNENLVKFHKHVHNPASLDWSRIPNIVNVHSFLVVGTCPYVFYAWGQAVTYSSCFLPRWKLPFVVLKFKGWEPSTFADNLELKQITDEPTQEPNQTFLIPSVMAHIFIHPVLQEGWHFATSVEDGHDSQPAVFNLKSFTRSDFSLDPLGREGRWGKDHANVVRLLQSEIQGTIE